MQQGGHAGFEQAFPREVAGASRQIIEAHNGAIWAENVRPEGAGLETEPMGARFVLELPG